MGAAPELLPPPKDGRTFTSERRVRLSDVTPAGKLRLDAIARYLQDVASDDVDDVEVPGPWVVRRSAVAVEGSPRFNDRVTVTTWCSGSGSRWAERRTTISAGARTFVESVALWVFVDARTGRPVRLDPKFFEHYGSAAAGRTVRARLEHPGPPPELTSRPFALRATDLDLLDHVNNAVFWAPVEEELARLRLRPRRAELEFRGELDLDRAVDVVVDDREAGFLALWLVVDRDVRASARVWTGG